MPQSLASVLIHLLFSTKNREPLIAAEVEADLYAYLGGAFRALGCPLLAGNGTEDHVHLLFRLSRTSTLAQVVEAIKSGSSKWMKGKGPRWAGFYWQAGYGAFSIGEPGVEALRRYIANQKERHRRRSFQEEYRQFLETYQIEYDERYVWD
jgi:REP element-mobilizing transposase RayT